MSFSVQAKTCLVVVKKEPFALPVGSLSLLRSPVAALGGRSKR